MERLLAFILPTTSTLIKMMHSARAIKSLFKKFERAFASLEINLASRSPHRALPQALFITEAFCLASTSSGTAMMSPSELCMSV